MVCNNQIAEMFLQLSDIIDLMPYNLTYFTSSSFHHSDSSDSYYRFKIDAKVNKFHRGVLVIFYHNGNIFFNDWYKKKGGMFEGTFDELMDYLREEYANP